MDVVRPQFGSRINRIGAAGSLLVCVMLAASYLRVGPKGAGGVRLGAVDTVEIGDDDSGYAIVFWPDWITVCWGERRRLLANVFLVEPPAPPKLSWIRHQHAGTSVGQFGRGLDGSALFCFANFDDGRYWPDELNSEGLFTRGITIPTWSAVFAFGLWPMVYAIQKRRRLRQVAAGYCAGCGYDLRASPHRCPECGVKVLSASGLLP